MRNLFTAILLLFVVGALNAQPTSVTLISPNGGETLRAGTSVDLTWDTTGTYRARWTFQFALQPDGPWGPLPGAANVLDSGATRGRFAGGLRVPAVKTTSGYIRIVLRNDDGSVNESVADANNAPFTIDLPDPAKVDSVLKNPITSRIQLSNKKIYGLDGYVFVDEGGVLAIEAGTIIFGDTVGQNSAICVNRGGKIYAQGTPQKPIVMTSSAGPGQRRSGDWGGLLICGKAKTNHPGGESALEGGIGDANKVRGWFGGTDDSDSSGVVSYVRIEFAGIAAAPNQELNSLTMGAVGSKTVLDHIQCSYGNDDAFEWFGGTVNAKYLIATGTLDDDFDGDNGWSGKVQFGLVQRFRERADVSTSQAFEMDNNSQGNYNEPLTKAVFSNVTAIGPLADTSWTIGTGANQFSQRFGAGAQLRRNNRTSILNTIFLGWPRGIELLGTGTQLAAASDSIAIKNNSWYGVKGQILRLDGTTPPINDTWLSPFANIVDASTPNNAKLTNPFAIGLDFNPVPQSGSPVLDGASFAASGVVPINDPFFTQVTYRGAFDANVANRWDLPWAEYDPINKVYAPEQEQQMVIKLNSPNGGETLRAGTSVDLTWDTTGTYQKRWVFQFSTNPNGPWDNLAGATNVLDSGATRGRFAGGLRVPAIKTTTAYVRMAIRKADGSADETMTDRSDAPFTIDLPDPTKVDSVLKTPVTNRVQLSNSKIYGLDGYVFVDEGGVLAIEAGTIIFGDTVGQNSAICVNRGGKIYAQGTPQKPIVMTSSAGPGQRRSGDWGGLLICGKAKTNHPGGESALEGGIGDANKVRGWFGGTDDSDSSGVVSYVRIEFAGIAAAPNQELNSLTMGAVGNKTVLDHIQCSYGNDDAFEWFGGTVNAKYLIATGTLDDDFDGDNGWSGKVQFGLVQRFRERADVSTSQAFEMDNNSQGNYNEPLTKAVFSNVTAIGPLADTSWTIGTGANQFSQRFGAGAQLRRNNRTSILNTIFLGWPRGIELLGTGTQLAALSDSIAIKNNSWYGVKGQILRLDGTTPPINDTWLSPFANIVDASTPNNAQLTNPFTIGLDFNPVPQSGSPVLDGASFEASGVVPINDPFFTQVTYRGAFDANVANRWDLPWAEYDPINKVYVVTGIDDNGNYFDDVEISIKPMPISTHGEIVYQLHKAGIVSINFYDMTGNLMTSRINNQHQEAGYWSFNLNANDLANGTYFLQIVLDGVAYTERVIVIK